MSWFKRDEYKSYLRQRRKEEKKRFKKALRIEKYRIKKSECLKYILNQILGITWDFTKLPETGYYIIEHYYFREEAKKSKFLFFTFRNEGEHDKEIFKETLNEVILFLTEQGYELVTHSTAIGGCIFQKSFYYSYYLKLNV